MPVKRYVARESRKRREPGSSGNKNPRLPLGGSWRPGAFKRWAGREGKEMPGPYMRPRSTVELSPEPRFKVYFTHNTFLIGDSE